MKRQYTYYIFGIVSALALLVTGVKAFEYTGISITRENLDSRSRFEIVCERVGSHRLDLSYVCDGKPKPPAPTPANCGNGIVESGEQCDGSAPEGYTCSSRCQLIDESILGQGDIVINEVYYDPDSRHGVEPANEWVEIYNAGTSTVDLHNWWLSDSEGQSAVIRQPFVMQPGEFAILTSEVSTINNYWNELIPEGTKVIVFGTHIGTGLDDDAEALFLNTHEGVVDSLSWGHDNSVFNLAPAATGNSLTRVVNGYDTNSPSDWHEADDPTPGF